MESLSFGLNSLDLASVPAETRQRRGLASLPDELLDKIIKDLLDEPLRRWAVYSCSSLSLTCKATRGPSQRALLSRVRVKTNHLQAFIDTGNANKDFCTIVKHFNLVLNFDWGVLSDLQLLRQIPLDWETLAGITITYMQSQSDKLYKPARQQVRDWLDATKAENIDTTNLVARITDILPGYPLERVVLDFYAKEDERLYDDHYSAPPLPLAAKELIIRDFVCHQGFRGAPYNIYRSDLYGTILGLTQVASAEEKLLASLGTALGEPGSLRVERCRMYPQLLQSLLDSNLGRALRTLPLDQLVRRNVSGLRDRRAFGYSLHGLTELRNLRIGAVDYDMIPHSPPTLQSLKLLYVNSRGAIVWLKSVVDTAKGPAMLPVPCSIRVGRNRGDCPLCRQMPRHQRSYTGERLF